MLDIYEYLMQLVYNKLGKIYKKLLTLKLQENKEKAIQLIEGIKALDHLWH